ncbi:MAG: S-layer homology domain-containing protein [Clostridia bacterium]|nr:S-layer homology domain-containing protein [Clostridia bacterium]
MKKQAALLLAAVMTVGGAFSASAAEVFADINDVPWGGAQAYINSAYENGLMVGDINSKGERVFRAKDNISYNETVQLVYMLSGETATDDMINNWAADMQKNGIPKWAYGCVSYALENGIITRTDIAAFMNYDGTSRNATREDAAYIFGRFLAKKGAEAKAGAKTFADKNKISAVCQKYVELLSSLDIMVGDENNNFNPNNAINRAEMAVIATKTNTFLKDITDTPVHEDKSKADYSGYINNVTDTSLMLYTFDGKSIILDRASNSQYYLDGEEISTRGIYSLTSNGILVKADVYVNSSNIAMEIYCTRADVEGKITGVGFKSGEYKRGSNKIPYAFYTVTMTYANGLSRSYRIDDDTEFYYDDKEIDVEDFQELIGKSLPVVDTTDDVVKECIDNGFEVLDVWEADDDYEKYLDIYGVADTEFNDEYYVYPQARIKELHLKTVMLETAVISAVNNEKITVLDENGYAYEYKLADGARFYVDGEKERITDFKKAVKLNYSTVEIKYDTDGYVTRISAETYK